MADDRLRFKSADEGACKHSYSLLEEEHYRNFPNEKEVDGSNRLIEKDNTEQPLGLKFKKTPSLLNFIKMEFVKNHSSEDDMAEKWKAVTIPFSLLRIGTWELKSRKEGHLVSKCYFAKKKLIWEILEGSLKRKLEMSWSDVIGLQVIMTDGTDNNVYDILNLELIQPPSFALELDPQPRKHTQWKDTGDFTDSQALIYRRHHLKFPQGNLAKLYNKLLKNDERIFELSKKTFPTFQTPYFIPRNEFDRSQFLAGHPPSFMVPRNEFGQSQFLAGHPTSSMVPRPQVCTSLITPPRSFSAPIPGFFHHYNTYQESSFPFTRPNRLTSSGFAVHEEVGVYIDHTLKQFDDGNNIPFGGVRNIHKSNTDLPPLPENTFLAKMERPAPAPAPGGYNSFPTQNFNNMPYLLGSTVVSDKEGVNQMYSFQAKSLDETTLLASRNFLIPSLDHQGRDGDEQIIAMLDQDAAMLDEEEDLYC